MGKEENKMDDALVKHRLDTHEKRLNNHAERLDKVERTQDAVNVKIENLCEKIEGQTKAIYWLIGLGATSLLGFFFYAIQQNIFN